MGVMLLSAVATWWLLGYKGELMYAHSYNRYMWSAFIEVCYMLYAMYTIGYLVAHLYNRYMCSAFIEICYMLYAMYSIGYLVATQLHVCTFIQSQYMCSAIMKDML